MPGMKYYNAPTREVFRQIAGNITGRVMALRPARQALCDRYAQTGKKKDRIAYKEGLESDLAQLGGMWGELQNVMPPLTQEDVQHPTDLGPLTRDENGTFPIVCPYCLSKFSADRLLYRAAVFGDGAGSGDGFGYEQDDPYENLWRKHLRVADADSIRPHILNPDVGSHEIAGVVFEKPDGSHSPVCAYNEETKNYMKYRRVVYLVDGYNNQTDVRICPECHTELPSAVGFVPNYIYTLVGNSGCGKTVYLNRLVLSLTGGMFKGYFGTVVNDESASVEFSVANQAKKVFAQNGEPMSNATDKGYIRPVIIEMTNMTNTEKRFYVTLFDFPGEALWNAGDFKQLALNNFTNSCGWLVVFDSGTLDFVRNRLPQNLRQRSSGNVSEEMVNKTPTEILQAIHTVFCHNSQFVRPVAFVLSKADLLREVAPGLQGQFMAGGAGDMTFLQPAQEYGKANLPDMLHCDREIRTLLAGTNVPQMGDMLCRHNCSWFAFSATNVPVEDGVIPAGAQVAGLRELQPLEWLLYRWGQMESMCDRENQNDVIQWGQAMQVEPNLLRDMTTLANNLMAEINAVRSAVDNLA